ncbi:DUF1304 domain-containing protein [[Mycobacterium] nativiensis]|uniref:DUF1304 domain-containing protein n=1 Tax=[Mycobacterium] nativiensis TaxID=2855503 RepID=A0ABU5XYC1_9MYCO|nr:DUF1304 domain-containing protein [Mycolicibacter sp. MYC340]MEB3032757.1 DUF1304 domain-containing protein [Mycolicibacter sp. MYC340]
MLIAGLSFAALAAVLHVYIFALESLSWTSPRTRAVFGTTADEAETTRMLAFNQGFYNLFLAVMTVVGICAVALGHNIVGVSLLFAGLGSMLAAALVLVASTSGMARAAVVQGAFPAFAIPLLSLSL